MRWLKSVADCYRINRQWGDGRMEALFYALQTKRFPEVQYVFQEEE